MTCVLDRNDENGRWNIPEQSALLMLTDVLDGSLQIKVMRMADGFCDQSILFHGFSGGRLSQQQVDCSDFQKTHALCTGLNSGSTVTSTSWLIAMLGRSMPFVIHTRNKNSAQQMISIFIT